MSSVVEAITIEDILAFVSVAECGSLNAAAERLGLAQSVVTRRIQRLEAALGIELLDRSVRPAALTQMGRQALVASRTVLRALADLRAIAQDETPAGELRLGVAPALADLALAAALGSLREHYPQVALRVHTDWTPQLLQQLRVGILDLAVVQLPVDAPAPAGLETRALGIERLVVVAAPSSGIGPQVELSLLAPFPWVLSPAGDGGRMLLESAFRQYSVPLLVAAELQGYESQAALVARGVGLGLLPARLLERSGAPTQLQPVSLLDGDLAVRIWSARAWPQGHLAAPLALLDVMLAEAVEQGLRAGRAG